MPTAKVKSILDEFSDMGGIHVTLSGGEVFLHKDIIEIARYCREKDLKITILSNLIALKDEQVTALKELNISLIQVSLYSMNPEIHDFITTVKDPLKDQGIHREACRSRHPCPDKLSFDESK